MLDVICPGCGGPVGPSTTRPRVYCSLRCRRRLAARRRRERARETEAGLPAAELLIRRSTGIAALLRSR